MIEQPNFKVGDMVTDKLEIVRRIGEGGSAAVYQVRDKFSQLDSFALKLIPLRSGPDFERRARDEVRVLHQLSRHPNVVQVFDAGITPDHRFIYIQMELLHGFSLRQVLDELKFLSFEELLTIGGAVCEALSALHELGVVHRDVKPGNVFICPGNRVKVLDFGIAKLPNRDTTGQQRCCGTPLYMAPEQLCGRRVSPRTDVYALGVMLHEAVLGRHLFHSDSADLSWYTISYMQIREEYQPLSKLSPGFPRVVSDIIQRATEKAPERRWRDALEMGGALAAELAKLEQSMRAAGMSLNIRDLVEETRRAATARGIPTEATAQAAATRVADPLEPFRRTTAKLVPAGYSQLMPPPVVLAAPPAGKPTIPNTPVALKRASPETRPTVPNTPVALGRAPSVPPLTTANDPKLAVATVPKPHGVEVQHAAAAAPARRSNVIAFARKVRGGIGRLPAPQLYGAACLLGLLIAVPLGRTAGAALASVQPRPEASGFVGAAPVNPGGPALATPSGAAEPARLGAAPRAEINDVGEPPAPQVRAPVELPPLVIAGDEPAPMPKARPSSPRISASVRPRGPAPKNKPAPKRDLIF